PRHHFAPPQFPHREASGIASRLQEHTGNYQAGATAALRASSCRSSTGAAMARPAPTLIGVARIIGKAASARSQRSHIANGARSQPAKAAESSVMLAKQEAVEPISSVQVKPGAMISME